MKKYLYVKYVLAILVLVLLGFCTIYLAGNRQVQKYLESLYGQDLYQEATAIARSQEVLEYYGKQEDITPLYDNLCTLSSYRRCNIWLISPKGNLLLNTDSELKTENFPVIEDFNPGTTSGSYYQTGNFFGQFKQPQLSVMVPVTKNMSVHGYVAIHLPMSILQQEHDSLMNLIYVLFLLFLLIMLAIIPVFSLMIYHPLRKIIQGADAFASGNLKYNIPLEKEDEMGYLAATLNYMSDELDMTGNYQRSFIANVSHDFRSPLTSIKGYTEAILDGTIPPELQDKYLNIISHEADRLEKLTRSLLVLNDLDERKRMMNIRKFDINDVIKNTANTFEVICSKKNIDLELLLSGRELFVEADMEQIQQVLYNLLDNAIKFSNDNSSINIETSVKNDKVFVSVKDHGVGIPKDSLSKVWDRFYKTDTSRGKDRKGTGLGLSIVKEIIKAHNQNINVISTEGVGTEFIFTLKKAK